MSPIEYLFERQVISDRWNIEAENSRLVEQIQEEGIFIFGAHKVGAKLLKACSTRGIRVIGFFDNDDTKTHATLDGLKILKPNAEITKDKVIVVASGRHSNSILNQLATYERCRALNIHKFQYLFDLEHQAEGSFRNFRDSLVENKKKFLTAFNRLSDDKSRQTFEGLLKIRLDLEISHSDRFKCDPNYEYCDELFIRKEDMESYVDVGAYNGDTLDRIEQFLTPAKKAFLFEPELEPYIKALSKYKERNSVYIFNLALSDTIAKTKYSSQLSFDSPAYRNQTSVTPSIQFVKLDSIGIDNVSFIKIDVEGGELAVLKGAQNLIRQFQPKLAVCAYHKANDYWEIIEYVLSLVENYRVGMRHYSDILDDTTLYFS